jgi:hypothetical protein
MGKLIVVALVGAAVFAGWELHSKGPDQAFGGALAPSAAATDDDKEALGARPTRLSPAAQMGAVPGVD